MPPHPCLPPTHPDTIVQGKDAAFGSAYVMEIPDTVVEGHQGLSEGSHEFLVFASVLLKAAAKHGLHPVRAASARHCIHQCGGLADVAATWAQDYRQRSPPHMDIQQRRGCICLCVTCVAHTGNTYPKHVCCHAIHNAFNCRWSDMMTLRWRGCWRRCVVCQVLRFRF